MIRRAARWWYDRPLRAKGLVVVAIPVLPLLLLSGFYFFAERRADAFEARFRSALELEKANQSLIISIQEARTGTRGYALTGDTAWFGAFRQARASVLSSLGALEGLLAERDEWAASSPELRRLVERKLESLERTLEAQGAAARGEPVEVPGALVLRGEAILDSIRVVMAPLRTEADSALLAFRVEGRGPALLPRRIVAAAGVLGILGGVLAGLVFSSSVAARIGRVEENTRRLVEDGEALVPAVEARDEIGRLARGLEEAKGILDDRRRALRASEERFALAVLGTSDGLWDWDLVSDELYLSPRWKELLGHEDHEIPHAFREFETRLHPEDRPSVRKALEAYLEGRGDRYEAEFRMKHRDGTWRWILSRGRAVWAGEGRAVRLVGAHTDVTERRRREEELVEARQAAEAANRAKSAFLAHMSHELRTPLNAVIGFAELLQDGAAGELTETQARYVGNVHRSGTHLLQVIDDILDLSRVEAGRMDLRLERFHPGPALEGSTEIVAGMAAAKALTVELELPDDLPPMTADQGRLKQILYNLLSNAVKFTEEGGRIALGARAVEGAGEGVLRIWVRDTGIGIAPEDRERIFEEFEQVDSSYGRKEQGTGLGLPLTSRLVALHGGTMSLESREGEGSTFVVELPLAGPEDAVPEAGEVGAPEGPATGSDGRPTVLVIEDEPWARDLLTGFLSEGGYRTLVARDGEEGVLRARRERPDAITLDVLLPGRDGWAVLRELKEDPGTRNIPVFVVTVTEDRSLGFTLGAAAFLRKPVTRVGLLEEINKRVPPRDRPVPSRVLVVDDDPATREQLSVLLREEGHEPILAGGGEEGISLARTEQPDLVVLELLLPGVTGFEVAAALAEDPRTGGIPILVWTAKPLAPEEEERLRTIVRSVSPKTSREAFVGALNRVLATEGPPKVGTDGTRRGS